MRARFAILWLICVTLAAAVAAGDVQRIDLGGNTALELSGQTDNTLTFDVSVGELVGFDVTTQAGVFTSLAIPDFHQSLEVGSPQLPMMNQLCEIPYGATPRVEILAGETTEIALADHGLVNPIMPAQASVPKNIDPATLPFELNSAAYRGGQLAGPALVNVVDAGQMRAVRIGRIEVAPVRYDPREGKIEVYTRLRFTVHFDGADRQTEAQLKEAAYSPFFEPAYQLLAGYRTPHTDHPDLMDGKVTYIIVSPRIFETDLQPFIAWKIRQGFNVIAAYTDMPEVGGTTTTIHNYLLNLYNTLQPAPTFVLFAGDINYVPCYYSSGATDLGYCDFTGDDIPEMYYGRFSARTNAELQPQITKTLEYEQATFPDASYLAEVVMIAGMDGNYGPTYANGQINYGTRHYFNTAHGLIPYVYLYPASGSSGPQIIQNVSQGVAYANYTAHGDVGGWSNPAFTNAHIDGLQNIHMYCLAVGNCCLTSSFDSGDCFAEHWLRANNKGAIGYIGAANYSYWNEDYWWSVGAKSVVPSGADYNANSLGAYDCLWHTHGEAIDQWYVVQDAMIFAGNLAVVQAGGMTDYYWHVYNLMGDPSLSPYLGVPTVNAVAYPEYIDPQSGIFPVPVNIAAEPNSYVGITKNGALVGSGLIGASGSGTISVNGHGTSGSVLLTVTCQNKFPFSVEIPISNPAAVTGSETARLALRVTPNPAGTNASLQFDLPSAQNVDLSIHDVSGRVVRTVFAGRLPAGQHTYAWDGNDGSGHSLPGGVYLARLQAETGIRTWKLVLNQ